MRPATSHTRASATDTGTGRGDPREGRTSDIRDGRTNSARTETQVEELTMQPSVPTRCPLCTACYTHPNSMRTHLRRTHGDQRKVVVRDKVSSNNADTRTTQQVAPMQRKTRRETRARLLSAKQVVRLGTWNVRTLRGLGKSQQLAAEMQRNRISILAVTETHLSEAGHLMLDEEKGYRLVFSGRKDGTTLEGVGIALDAHAWAALRHYQAVSPRILTAEFLSLMGPLMIVVVYAPTEDSSEEDKEQFYSELDEVMRKANGLTMVMGDFNASIGESVQGVVGPHALGKRTSSNGEKLVSFASAHGMCVTNTVFPHKRIHQYSWYPPNPRAQASLKDYILVKQRLRPSVLDTRVFRGADLNSDHRLVVMSMRLKLKRKPRQRSGKPFDVRLLKQVERRGEFLNTIWSAFEGRSGRGNVEKQWTGLKKALVDAAEQHLHQRRQPQKEWISTDTLRLTEEKRVAFVMWQNQRACEEKRKHYVALCKLVRQSVKKDKEKWWDENMAAMEEDLRRCRQGDFFKKLKRLSGSKTRPPDTILDEVGQPLQRNEDKLARWRRHFQDVLNVENAVAAEVLAEVEDNGDTDTPDVTREEVVKAVRRLQNGKAAGDDRIVAELLKSGGETVIVWLTELIEEVWRTRKVPQDWRNATLIPLFKKKDRTQCNNYRGISLLSVPGKVLTLILLERLQAIIEPQLLETQCGFRKGRGTVDQIWVVRQVVERATEYRTPVFMCFVDLTKAYDSVNRQAMAAILREYGVPRQLVAIIEELHSETWCQVRSAGDTSERFEVTTGVRQGCVLSPLLFNCFLDKILREAMANLNGGLQIDYTTSEGLFLTYRDKTTASTSIQDALYADDLTLVAESRGELQDMVNAIDNACRRWGMTISATKTKILAVGEPQSSNQPSITLQNQPLEEVESFTYLGSEIGQSINVEREVSVRLEKAGKVYQIWRKKVFRSRALSIATKVRIFRTLVLSVLLYGAETWTVTQHDIRKLNSFQMRCLRDILGITLWNRVRNSDILERTGMVSMEDQLKQRRLQWFGHVWRMPTTRPQRQLLRCRPSGRRRPTGGAPLRWCDLISRDLRDITNWTTTITDRQQWRTYICQNVNMATPAPVSQRLEPAQRP